MQNQGFNTPNVDDLPEYRGGMGRYQLSHRTGYDEDIGDENEDDYMQRRHRFHSYGHRVADEDDDDDFDEDDGDDEIDADGMKKSKIRKPHHAGHHNENFRQNSNSSRGRLQGHIKYKKDVKKPNVNTTTKATRKK